MNLFSGLFDLLCGIFQTAKRSEEERDQQGPEGRAYDKWLDKHGYEAQYQAWLKEHGSPEGFVYRDPGYSPETME